MKTFFLPDLGEGLAEGEIVKWHIKEGDTVQVDAPFVSIETAKAIVEVPSPYSGKILKLYGKEGDIIPTNGPLADFSAESKQDSGTVAGEIKIGNEVLSEKAFAISHRGNGKKVLPAVRALAKKLNVDLNVISPTGPDNLITAEDVKKTSIALQESGPLEPLKGVRRAMALTMIQSHAEIVPVTVVDDADISTWVKEKERDFTVRIILAMVKAWQQEPALNAWFDGQILGRRMLSRVNVGLAVDTQEGLFVPVIHDAHKKSAQELRQEIDQIKTQVHDRSLTLPQLQGASIVLSNYGKFAGRYATPVITLPMVAILGVGSFREEVAVVGGEIGIRTILPLSLTFDHRAVTGGEATRFLAYVIQSLMEK